MKERTLHKKRDLKKGEETSSLILYNDDYNTFDHVIKSLVEVCGHDFVQAEQCAMIVHYHGSYEIKRGSAEVLTSMSRSLNERGLTSRVIT
ncbi:MAG TPA: ATP-dependent Clp protease adaptor ClpS [Bacteroidales bacterium]|jgi:ATP-dependent Clp protease adaptor protein ClpS|nr:ATP-dependent Clp protease adaptor ClpS [Bacteroidales bacterium]OQB61618.1 MAG: ATP-dependent Clp protease adaptor protein ClpS [Bacteroidetes bacterium ADurb.Bin145]NMD01816.1 ATP-dependent Clp protease adaptor ClpS [Bacteroidales bacterium]HOU01444.1 ATP-dependent Clp protease adaptor ClpS [Bacteroidales bacterium]HQG62873.1 ATP-dependent Clp protease adaptor ClpS [Bacteroidales bacterium]